MIITDFCTGCRACEQLCPTHCIYVEPDEEGFIVAKIDENACVECGVCVKRCPQNNPPEKNVPIRVVGIRYKDNDVLKESASGGVFIALASRVLDEGGIAVGAAYLDDWKVGHIIVNDKAFLYKLQSSKYVQSDTFRTFSEVKEYLVKGRKVLYSGTPCQIEGLYSYLRKDYDNLFTIDLICHGVPSPKLFQKYIKWLETKNRGVILYYNFRDKSSGWGLGYKTKTKTKIITKSAALDPYYYHFLKGDIYRECCYRCNYCTRDRVGDITIGDYWGIEKEHPEFYSTKGVSLALINTPKGMNALSDAEELFYIQESTFERAVKANHNLSRPTERSSMRDTIYLRMNELTVEELFEKELKYPFNLMTALKGILPVWLKLLLKKMK
jgi:coenzyme F420-reducing hydrogenase beta subunit